MPHCMIEHSNTIQCDPARLMNAVFSGAFKSGLFAEDHIKTRTLPYQNYLKGRFKEKFIHVSARILSGRSLEQRIQLSKLILAQLNKLELTGVTITVEVIEMERESYVKSVS